MLSSSIGINWNSAGGKIEHLCILLISSPFISKLDFFAMSEFNLHCAIAFERSESVLQNNLLPVKNVCYTQTVCSVPMSFSRDPA